MTTIEEGDTYRRDVNEAEFTEAISQLREGGEVDPESAGNDFDRWLLPHTGKQALIYGGGRPTMSDAIEAVRAELESARHALRGAEEAYGADEKARLKAQDRAARSYEGAARNRRNVDRLTKALEILEGEE